jgi:HTH-type transcriptional regulator, transcriptional repressor of NAD biosynthesis genes
MTSAAAPGFSTFSIAILGAECTGKSELAQALAAHFARHGRSVHCVPEYLREWCAAQQRTPLAHEQAAIATEQARRVLTAPPTDLLIADTTPLMTAVYSDIYFGDTALYAAAIRHQQRFNLTLLANTDVPWVADGVQRDGLAQQLRVQARLREVLLAAQLPFHEVAGLGAARLRSALSGIQLSA